MKSQVIFICTIVCVLSVCPVHSSQSDKNAVSEVAIEQLKELVPETTQHLESRYITKFLVDFHISKPKIDNQFSESAFSAFMAALDPEKNLFTQAELKDLQAYSDKFDNALLTGWLEPAYEIANLAIRRKVEKSRYLQSQLEKPDSIIDLQSSTKTTAFRIELETEEDLKAAWLAEANRRILEIEKLGFDNKLALKSLLQFYKNQRTRVMQLDSSDIFNILANAACSAIDPHTVYYPARKNEDKERIANDLSRVGIGTSLSANEYFPEFQKIVLGGAVDNSKQISEGDLLLAITESGSDMHNLVGLPLKEVTEMIRGEQGSIVNLQILKKDNRKIVDVELKRSSVALLPDSIEWEIKQFDNAKVAVVRIPTFYVDWNAKFTGDKDYRSVSRDLKKILSTLDESSYDALVIDLENNGGGVLNEAVNVSGIFVGKQTILRERNNRGTFTDMMAESDALVSNKPIVVLVNRVSAGAAEILAASLQDYAKAIVVGSGSYGLGVVQRMLDLQQIVRGDKGYPFGALKLSTSEYYRATGHGFQAIGVMPDITFARESGSGKRAADLPRALSSVPIELKTIEADDLSVTIKALSDDLQAYASANRTKEYQESNIEQAIELARIWVTLQSAKK